eukprot:14604659-Alexandrium_andersonii.AAC.1
MLDNAGMEYVMRLRTRYVACLTEEAIAVLEELGDPVYSHALALLAKAVACLQAAKGAGSDAGTGSAAGSGDGEPIPRASGVDIIVAMD